MTWQEGYRVHDYECHHGGRLLGIVEGYVSEKTCRWKWRARRYSEGRYPGRPHVFQSLESAKAYIEGGAAKP